MSRRFNNHEETEYEGKFKKSSRGNKGKWSEEEDELLRDGVNELGNQWSEIAKRITGRTIIDCHQRWEYSLNPDLVKGPWTPEVTEYFNPIASN